MGLQINTNVTALGALRNLSNTSAAVSGSIEKLSSGLRINNASDDPAGLIISENLRAQIDGLNQAVSNSQDATNVIKTAEGALTEVNSLLRSVRQLAVHAGNTGVNDSVAVQADQTQITSAVQSIERIASQTQFGTKHLLDGTSGTTASVVAPNLVAGISIGGTFQRRFDRQRERDDFRCHGGNPRHFDRRDLVCQSRGLDYGGGNGDHQRAVHQCDDLRHDWQRYQ